MSDTAESALQQINKAYKLLDEIFHKLDTKDNLNEHHFKYAGSHLDEVIQHLQWINTYLELGD